MSTDWPTPTRPRPHPVLPWCGALFCVPGPSCSPAQRCPASWVRRLSRRQLRMSRSHGSNSRARAAMRSPLWQGRRCCAGPTAWIPRTGVAVWCAVWNDRRPTVGAPSPTRAVVQPGVCPVVGPGAAERAVRTQPAVSDGNADTAGHTCRPTSGTQHACLSRTPGRGAGGCAGWSSGGPTTSVCRADSAGLGLIAGCGLQRGVAT